MLKRFLPLFFLGGLFFLHAQETPKGETKEEAATPETDFFWKVANFAIFAGGIGYAIVKFAPAFFNARSADIQKAIQDATGLKMNADLRYSEIDRKMANLSGEVGKLRSANAAEMEREHERLLGQTEDEIAYIKRSTTAEIDILRGEGADKLRAHTTEQALAAAEARLRARFAQNDQKDLLKDFVQLVEQGGPKLNV